MSELCLVEPGRSIRGRRHDSSQRMWGERPGVVQRAHRHALDLTPVLAVDHHSLLQRGLANTGHPDERLNRGPASSAS